MNTEKVFALGFFDGVHLGHQALLAQCRRLAAEKGCQAAAVTFDVTPASVFSGQKPNMINTAADRLHLLEQYGMESVAFYVADRQTLNMPWGVFLEELLAKGGVGFVCGEDFRFGKGGAGTAAILQAFCKERNLPCVVVAEQKMDGERISSTRIRQLLEDGQLEQANRLLGHTHIFSGEVVKGKQLGRAMGFPTANVLLPPELLVPKAGVYACKVIAEGREYPAVVNVGICPTVGEEAIKAEAFLLDFDGDLYGKTITIAFYQFLRPEKKFSSLEELQAEIAKNTLQTRIFFGKSE